MKRSTQQNKLYHEYAGQLYQLKKVVIYDGRFAQYAYPNPMVICPLPFSYDTFRELLKACDWEYEKDSEGRPISSTKLSIEDMGSHITFLQCLLDER